MSDFPISILDNPDPFPGDGLLPTVGRAARNLLCAIHDNFPGALVPPPDPEAPIASALAGLMANAVLEGLCPTDPDHPPVPPAVPFSGGQCPIYYQVVVTRTTCKTYTGDYNHESGAYYVWGQIKSVTLEDPGANYYRPSLTGYKAIRFVCYGYTIDGSYPPTYRYPESRAFDAIDDSYFTLSIDSIVVTPYFHTDTDSCGNPAPIYPTPPITIPTVSVPTVISFNSPPVNVTVPVTLLRIENNFNGIYSPKFVVDVGGVNVSFSGDRIDFSVDISSPSISIPNISNNYPAPTPIAPNNNPPPTRTAPLICECDLSGIESDLSQVESDLALIKSKLKIPPGAVSTQSLGSGISGEFPLPAGCYAVAIQLSILTGNPRAESGFDAPDVYYAGWMAFALPSGLVLPREHLTYLNGVFAVPEYAVSVTYTCRVGYTATVTAYLSN
uniref:Uncharacterized protein n=1 Tax=uncultured prokaryote TaxID=198431 RepID=A0A0H5Q4D2_9ZZZZ|nr:hypothetical protein [uncultured prokaryote]